VDTEPTALPDPDLHNSLHPIQRQLAQRIAERGGMARHLANVALTRARLSRDRAALAEARRLIGDCGYGRRLPELEDAEATAADW
jgi:hypothetical protein